jgi:hypothetical protein
MITMEKYEPTDWFQDKDFFDSTFVYYICVLFAIRYLDFLQTQTLLYLLPYIWYFPLVYFFGKDQTCIWSIHELGNLLGF